MPGTAPSTAPIDEQRRTSHQLRNTSFAPWICEKRDADIWYRPTIGAPRDGEVTQSPAKRTCRATNGTMGSPSHR